VDSLNGVAALQAKEQRVILVSMDFPGSDAGGGNRMRCARQLLASQQFRF